MPRCLERNAIVSGVARARAHSTCGAVMPASASRASASRLIVSAIQCPRISPLLASNSIAAAREIIDIVRAQRRNRSSQAMSVRGRPPFRADHVGSLLRPGALRQAFRQFAGREIDEGAFASIQDDSIRGVVKLQEEVGLEVVTDGEFRRGSYWGRFVERTDGFEIRPAIFRFRDDHGHEVDFTAPHAVGRIRRTQPLALDEFLFLRDVAKVTPKITLPSPSTMHFYRCTDYADAAVYSDTDTFFADL